MALLLKLITSQTCFNWQQKRTPWRCTFRACQQCDWNCVSVTNSYFTDEGEQPQDLQLSEKLSQVHYFENLFSILVSQDSYQF